MDIEILYQIILMLAGIGTIMYGIKVMNGGVEGSLGFKFKKILAKQNKKHFKNYWLGSGMSFLLQTSTVTNVMTIGLIDIGTINLSQGVAISLGAGLGGALAVVLLMFESFNVLKILCVLVLVGAIIFIFAKSNKLKLVSKVIIGFGLLCLGITILSTSINEVIASTDLTQAFLTINNPILFALICFLLTVIMQSGYPVIVILISLLASNLIDANTACFGLLGVNIGSTMAISLLMAGFCEGYNGRRILVFNILHKVVISIILGLLMLIPGWINYVHNSICGGIASISVVVFDVIVCVAPIVLIPLCPQLAALMEKIMKEKKVKTKDDYASFELDEKTFSNPVVAYEKIKINIKRIFELILNINKNNHEVLFGKEKYISQKTKIKAAEKAIKLTNNNLILIAGKFSSSNLTKINTLMEIVSNLQQLLKTSSQLDDCSEKKSDICKKMHPDVLKFVASYSTEVLDFGSRTNLLFDEKISKKQKNNELKTLFSSNDLMIESRNKHKKKIITNSKCLVQNNDYYFTLIYELENMQQDYFDIIIKVALLED